MLSDLCKLLYFHGPEVQGEVENVTDGAAGDVLIENVAGAVDDIPTVANKNLEDSLPHKYRYWHDLQ